MSSKDEALQPRNIASDRDWLPEARVVAAQCWCDPTTSSIEMDATLAEVFAHRLAGWMEEAARYAQNADYWRERAERAEAEAAALLSTLKWLDRWLGDKPMMECAKRVRNAIDAARNK